MLRDAKIKIRMGQKMREDHSNIDMFDAKVGTKSIKNYDYIKASKEGYNLKVNVPIHLEDEDEEYNPESNPYKNLKGIASPKNMNIKGYKKVNLNNKLKDEDINAIKLDN